MTDIFNNDCLLRSEDGIGALHQSGDLIELDSPLVGRVLHPPAPVALHLYHLVLRDS